MISNQRDNFGNLSLPSGSIHVPSTLAGFRIHWWLSLPPSSVEHAASFSPILVWGIFLLSLAHSSNSLLFSGWRTECRSPLSHKRRYRPWPDFNLSCLLSSPGARFIKRRTNRRKDSLVVTLGLIEKKETKNAFFNQSIEYW